MSTAGKREVISSPTSVKVVSMIATSSVHKIIPSSDTITSPPPTSKEAETVEPETEEPVTEERKTEEPETEEPVTGTFVVTVNIPTILQNLRQFCLQKYIFFLSVASLTNSLLHMRGVPISCYNNNITDFVFVVFLELMVELRIQKKWDDDLEDEKSDTYKQLSFLLEKEARISYLYTLILALQCNYL